MLLSDKVNILAEVFSPEQKMPSCQKRLVNYTIRIYIIIIKRVFYGCVRHSLLQMSDIL